jgi:outer membrane protein assembly factor BamB
VTTDTTPKPRRVRRLWIPLLFALPALISFGVMIAANNYDLGDGMIFQSMMLFQMFMMLAIFGIGLWFFLLSGIAWKLRVTAIVLLVAAVGGAIGTIRTVEFDGQMTPKVVWRWDADPTQILTTHLATAAKAVDAVNLAIGPTDSAAFRNAGDGSTPGVTLADWTSPPKIVWQHPVGGGHAGVAVAGNSAVTIEQRGDDEVVVCYDRQTGKERWAHSYPAKFVHTQPMGGGGPRTTPAIAPDGLVYTVGGQGDLVCLDGLTGKPKWTVKLFEVGNKNIEWGMSGSPLVVGDLVVVSPGSNDQSGEVAHRAYDRLTGQVKWAAGTTTAAYASPMLAAFASGPQLVFFDAFGLTGRGLSGNPIWSHPWKSPMDMNSAQPVVVGPNRLLVSSEKDNGSAVLEITGDKTTVVWKTRRFAARYCTPVYHNGYIYGLTDGRLHCLNASTGEVKWSDGSFGNGQIVRAGDRLVITNEKGSVHLVAADPDEFRELGSVKVFNDRTWNMPALAGKQLFVRNHREMACVELP